MSVLFRRSNFFIDFETMAAYTDTYVAKRLVEFMKINDLNPQLFERLLYDLENFSDINQRLQAKLDVNFLISYINWDIVSTLDEADPIGLCSDLYNSCLYQEFDKADKNSPDIEFTSLGDTIRAITKDKNTDSICVYMRYPCDYLEDKIGKFFQSTKIHIVTGNKEEFLKEHTFDSYFFEDISDVHYIERKHALRSEVIIPTFPFNVSGCDVTQDMEVFYSQDSLFKLPILEKNPLEYLTEYNLDLAMIDIPL